MATFYPPEVEYDESDINDFFAENDISAADELTPALLCKLFMELTKEYDLTAKEVERGMQSLLNQIFDSIPNVPPGKIKGQRERLEAGQLAVDSFALWKDGWPRQEAEQELKLAESENVVSPVENNRIQGVTTAEAAIQAAASILISAVDDDHAHAVNIDKGVGTDPAVAPVYPFDLKKDPTSTDNGTQSDHPTNSTSASFSLASAFASSSSTPSSNGNTNVTYLTDLLKDAIAEFETGEFARSLILLVKATSFTVAQGEMAAQQSGRNVPGSENIEQVEVFNGGACSANKTPCTGAGAGDAAEESQPVKRDENLIELQ